MNQSEDEHEDEHEDESNLAGWSAAFPAEPRPWAEPRRGERGHGRRPAAWWLQSRGEYGTGLEKACVSQKHEMHFFDDFLFLRNRAEG
jgi:hypothetical protein